MSLTGAEREWLRRRQYLNSHRAELTTLASRLYPPAMDRIDGTVLLTRPGWIPPEPLPLERVTLAWTDPPPAVAVTGCEAAARGALPGEGDGVGTRGGTGGRYPSYAAAVAALDPPHLFVNRPVYRLTGADLTRPAATMAFAAGRYFDVVDVGEAVAHELAAVTMAGRPASLGDLPLRALVGDPTATARRSAPVAITTLTIRYDAATGRARFLAHWRDPAKVATNPRMYQVVPVGMFQPAGANPDAAAPAAASAGAAGPGAAPAAAGQTDDDFDLWRCMVREYSEELLGATEHEHVDYGAWPLFGALARARASGNCRPYCLGIGVDPLTLATDVLAVVVFEAATFDALFSAIVGENAEGRIVAENTGGLFAAGGAEEAVVTGDRGGPGLPFTRETIDRLIGGEHVQPAGVTVLRLAWRYRDRLLVAPPRRIG